MVAYLNLEKAELTEEKQKEANKASISEIGDEGKNRLRFDPEDHTRIEEITEDGVINVISESSFGYISLDVKLDDEDLITLIGLITKRMNKFKAVIEGLKS